METINTHFLHQGGVLTLSTSRRSAQRTVCIYETPRQKSRASPMKILAAMTKDNKPTAVSALPTTTTTVYKDNWFELLAIQRLSKSIEDTTGVRNGKKGYDSLVEASSVVSRSYGPQQQQELVIKSLKKAFPAFILKMIRTLMPQSRFSRQCFALFATVFFRWLVGPCEVRESEMEGRKEKNVVYIHKCRFLESTNCVGMCTNMCKVPSQKFIQDSLGMPVYMVPKFEDMSCEMVFGQHPPADDPALKQPCYQSLCIAKQRHAVDCSGS